MKSVFAAMLGDLNKDKGSLRKILILHENQAWVRDRVVSELRVAALGLDGSASVIRNIRLPSDTNL